MTCYGSLSTTSPYGAMMRERYASREDVRARVRTYLEAGWVVSTAPTEAGGIDMIELFAIHHNPEQIPPQMAAENYARSY